MKIQLVSDIHTELYSNQGRKLLFDVIEKSNGVETLVIAGDLCNRRTLKYCFSILAPEYENIIYVPGNHEYYESTFGSFNEELNEVCEKYGNIHFLNNSSVEIGGNRFLGGTLWYRETEYVRNYKKNFSDFMSIHDAHQFIFSENSRCINYIDRNLSKNDILVTHHLPSYKCVSERFRHMNNDFWVCDIEDIIFDAGPKLCLFGHTHDPVDIRIGDARVVACPTGYEHEKAGEPGARSLILDI